MRPTPPFALRLWHPAYLLTAKAHHERSHASDSHNSARCSSKRSGKPPREIFLTELIGNTVSRPFLDDAASALADGEYARALIAARKAFFLGFEQE